MEHIQPILQQVINNLKAKTQINKDDIQQIWTKANPKKISQNTLAKILKNGVLYVNVKNSCWKYELTIKKESILANLNKYFSKEIKDIKFRIGEVKNENEQEAKKG